MYKFLVLLVSIFLVAFPKGGIKMGETPITFGYVLLLVYALFSFFYSLAEGGGKFYLKEGRQYVLLCCLPFQLYSIFILLLSVNTVSFGYTLSFILSLIIIPFIFLFIFNRFLDGDRFQEVFIPVFKNCIRFVSIFGVILFFYKIVTGKDFEIPFLTVNSDDVGTIGTKYNMRGSISKLVSTYNNGNIYGISLLILLPLYFEREKYFLFKSVLILSLILTLSRTVWAGLVLYLLIYFFTKINNLKGWIIIISSLLFIAIAGPLLLNFMHVDIDFVFDKKLGGRLSSFDVFNNLTLFGSLVYSGISEIVYTSILGTFGIFGFILFMLYLFSPVVIYYFKVKQINPVNKSTAFWGLAIYWFLCLSDGAMLLIPVMAFYWFLAAYIFSLEQKEYQPDSA